VGTAHASLLFLSKILPTPLPPYKSVRHIESKENLESKKIGPCFGSGPGDRPHFSSSVSLAIEGDGAPTGRSARITPGGVSGLLRTMRCTCDAPRALRRANAASWPLRL